MNWQYIWKELLHRRRRYLTATIGIAIGIAVLVIINALAAAYKQASSAPLQEIGADITIQRSGDVPAELNGPVFSCSAVTIQKKEFDEIATLPGVTKAAAGLLLWVFDQNRFSMVLGIDPNSHLGPGLLRTAMLAGNFLEAGDTSALVEVSYARQYKMKIGDLITIADKQYPITGIVDGSVAGKIAAANIYLTLAEARKMALAAKQIQQVSPFGPEDVNIIFLKADQNMVRELSQKIKEMMGKNITVGSSESFMKLLGNLFALSDKFSIAVSLIVIVIITLLVFKIMAGNVAERTHEIGLLKAVGWQRRDVVKQLLAESILQSSAGGMLGLIIALPVIAAFSLITLKIPIPWEMSPFPHFLPGGGEPVFKTVALVGRISGRLALFAMGLSIAIGAMSGVLLSRKIAGIKPSEVLQDA